MPIQLQNHRTSNAKLRSAAPNKQKLHTAASLQKTQKLKVSKTNSGSGWGRMFHRNKTNATPNLPDELPKNRRRHSMTGNIGASEHSTTGYVMPPQLKRETSEPIRKKSPMRRITSLDTSSSSTNSSSSRKKNVRRSKSFGTPRLGPPPSLAPSGGEQRSEQRRAMRRRHSGDALRDAFQVEPEESPRESLMPEQSPRESLRSKRDQLRRKSMGSAPLDKDPNSELLDNYKYDPTYCPSDNDSDSYDDDDYSGSS